MAKYQLSRNKIEFLQAAADRFGDGAEVKTSDLQDLKSELGSIDLYWIFREPAWKVARGLYKLPLLNSLEEIESRRGRKPSTKKRKVSKKKSSKVSPPAVFVPKVDIATSAENVSVDNSEDQVSYVPDQDPNFISCHFLLLS